MGAKKQDAEPKKKDGLRRKQIIGMKVNELELNYIKTVSKIKGMSVSEYLRKCAMNPSEYIS